MEHARKMVLLPEESVRRVEQHLAPFPQEFKSSQTPGTASKRLDAEMSDVLNSDIYENDREKWNTYQQVFQRFLALKNIDSAKKRKVEEVTKKNDDTKENLQVFNVLQNVPKTYNDKANKLLEFIKKTPNIEWNNSGKIFIDGAEVVGADMAELINDAVRHRKTAKPARGREQLAGALRRAGVPGDYIGNERFWKAGEERNINPQQTSILRSSANDSTLRGSPSGTSSPIASSSKLWESWPPPNQSTPRRRNQTRRRV